ncbi:stage V sporulation protein AB [Gracilibacillus halotolerans]|uniref:Stage V sporulation protein AB n=1 Tax=Gracilibacillus halotolerans TaxID=74386 RepID=A0A841RGU8_9BACI|nr:stage V sporulation protein AB [Gracilibacillus halotolerans]MBB6511699.1 stage V sporulation protein AB [Gracilibacillus halotolerans]
MTLSLNYLYQIVIGLGSGLIVGAGFVAFLAVLGIIPRLVQISKFRASLTGCQNVVVIGSLLGLFITFTDYTLTLPYVLVLIWGLIQGMFVGMLAAALTEILNVFPILMKRIRLDNFIQWLIMSLVIGKIIGSLFHWIVFVDWMP